LTADHNVRPASKVRPRTRHANFEAEKMPRNAGIHSRYAGNQAETFDLSGSSAESKYVIVTCWNAPSLRVHTWEQRKVPKRICPGEAQSKTPITMRKKPLAFHHSAASFSHFKLGGLTWSDKNDGIAGVNARSVALGVKSAVSLVSGMQQLSLITHLPANHLSRIHAIFPLGLPFKR
jgi:hypothetical protein